VKLSTSDFQALKEAAKKASENSYAPYSKFVVGAAFLGDDGIIYAGANVENASYGLTVCAERSAIFSSIVKGNRSIRAMVIYTPTAGPTAPCGSCRQVIMEFSEDAEIISICDTDRVIDTTLSELLPDAFGPIDVTTPAAGIRLGQQRLAGRVGRLPGSFQKMQR